MTTPPNEGPMAADGWIEFTITGDPASSWPFTLPPATFELIWSEDPPAGLRRVMIEQVDRCLALLEQGEADWDTAVHEIRKSCKRVRGVLRLLRGSIGEEIYRMENAVFRDAARPLSPLRDTTVMLETLAQLLEDFDSQLADGVFGGIRHHLTERHRFAMGRAGDSGELRATTAVELAAARDRLAAWPVDGRYASLAKFADHVGFITPEALIAAEIARGGAPLPSRAGVPDRPIGGVFADLAPGLAKTYRRGRRRMRDAFADPTVERFHEWRKRVKYLRYQLEVLRPVWAEVVEEHAGAAASLAELLGAEHDLAELAAIVRSRPEIAGTARERSALLGLIRQRRAELQAEARTLGELVYFESPHRFVTRIEAYWESWRRTAAAPIP